MDRSKRRAVWAILLCILAVVLAVIIGLLIDWDAKELPGPTTAASSVTEVASQAQTPTEPVPSETTSVPEAGGNVIPTPYITLVFPEEFCEYLSVETVETPVYTVKLAALVGGQTYPLFDLCFGGQAGDTIGAVETENGSSVPVKAVMHELHIPADLDAGDAQTIYAMQEAVALIARQLPEAEGAAASEPEDLIVETPFCDLCIPGKWADRIQIEIKETNGYAVCFSGTVDGGSGFPLFDVILDGEGDEYVGTLVLDGGLELAVCMNTYELTPDRNWTAEETDTAYALLELVNDVLDGLKAHENFIAAER